MPPPVHGIKKCLGHADHEGELFCFTHKKLYTLSPNYAAISAFDEFLRF
jgi:hypothetical protein